MKFTSGIFLGLVRIIKSDGSLVLVIPIHLVFLIPSPFTVLGFHYFFWQVYYSVY